MNVDGSNPIQLTTVGQNWVGGWSKASDSLIFYRRQNSQNDVYVMRADGTGETNLTNSPGNDYDAAWSPDGNHIVYSGGGSLWLMNTDGSNKTQLTNSPTQDYRPVWSPDGTKIMFARPRANLFDPTQDLWVVGIPSAPGLGIGLQQLTASNGASYSPAWSLDGSQVAFASNRNGVFQIFMMNADGTAQTAITSSLFETYGTNWR